MVEAGADLTTNEGTLSPLAPSTFTDVGTADLATAQINWGDGTIESGTVTQGAGSGSVAGSHAYADNGIYTVTVTVTDNDGGSGTDTLTVTAAPATYTNYAAGAHGTITVPPPRRWNRARAAPRGPFLTTVPLVRWDDGLGTATRTDTNVTANHTFTAIFTRDPSNPSNPSPSLTSPTEQARVAP